MQKPQKNLNIKIKKNIIQKNKLTYVCLYIHCTIKNTLITLSQNNGNILKQWSTKSLQKKDLKKNNPYNVQLIINQLKKYLYLKRFYNLIIFFKGKGLGRYNILKNLKSKKNKKIKIIYIKDITTIPFNGCRKKKIKRR